MSVKITALAIENVKRVRAVRLAPTESGLTVIGGRNGSGKTSVLDAIAWTLGGAKLAPSDPARDGAGAPPETRIELSNGLVVERKGKNGSLKVTDPRGMKAGQALLDAFVSTFALNLPAFLAATPKEKAETLLRIIGVGEALRELDERERALYQERTVAGRRASDAAGHAASLPEYPDVSEEPVKIGDLAMEYQAALDHNANIRSLERQQDECLDRVARASARVDVLRAQLQEAEQALARFQRDAEGFKAMLSDVEPIDVDPIRSRMEDAESVAERARANEAKRKAREAAGEFQAVYDRLTAEIEDVRKERAALLEGAELPLPELSVVNGELGYRGRRWDGMSGAEQLRVATAIVSRLNPECGFVLVDKLEQMDPETLREFAAWAEERDLQVLATRVSTGGECTIVLEDGVAQEPTE